MEHRAAAVTGSHFGGDRDVHLLIQWSCGPTDIILAHCSKSTACHPCSPSETAGVYCLGTSVYSKH